MGKFTKTLVAVAVAGLVAGGPAQAGGLYASSKAVIKITASNCITDKLSPLDMNLLLVGGEGGGSNIGFWESELFSFGDEIDGGGPFIAAKPVTKLAMGMTPEAYFAMEELMEEYLFGFNDAKDKENCKAERLDGDGLEFNFGDADITTFQTKVSKNEERAKLTLRVSGSYHDIGAIKDRNVKLVVKSGTMRQVID
jgi:hypothetical protein